MEEEDECREKLERVERGRRAVRIARRGCSDSTGMIIIEIG